MQKTFYKLLDHPVAQHKLTVLRNRLTTSKSFRSVMKELGTLLAYEATHSLELQNVDIETPIAKMTSKEIKEFPIVISILRAGNGMIDGVLDALPMASAGHIGIYRDKYIENTVEYYFKIPENSSGKDILLLDPLIATADTAIACIDRLKKYNVGKIKLLSVLSSQLGLERLYHFHPDVEVITLSIEKEMDDNGYLVPGLGDAGNRLYSTR